MACSAVGGAGAGALVDEVSTLSPLTRHAAATRDGGIVPGGVSRDEASARTRLGFLLIVDAGGPVLVVLLITESEEGGALRDAILARTPSPICTFWELREAVEVTAILLLDVRVSCACATPVWEAVFGAAPLTSRLISN